MFENRNKIVIIGKAGLFIKAMQNRTIDGN